MSSTPWWLGPSGPVIPARSRAKTTGRPCRPTSRLAWSKARLKNVEYTATTGRRPPMAMPAAEVTAFCSAIPTSKNRSGQRACEGQQPGRPGHGRGDGHHVGVGLADLEHGLVERLGVALGGPGRFGRPDGRVEDRGVVQALLVVVLGRAVAPALLGDDVDHDRAVELVGLAQGLLHAGDVVAVDRARRSARRGSRRTPAARSPRARAE